MPCSAPPTCCCSPVSSPSCPPRSGRRGGGHAAATTARVKSAAAGVVVPRRGRAAAAVVGLLRHHGAERRDRLVDRAVGRLDRVGGAAGRGAGGALPAPRGAGCYAIRSRTTLSDFSDCSFGSMLPKTAATSPWPSTTTLERSTPSMVLPSRTFSPQAP